MANIREYLAQILSARYGKDVRQSIHDSIEEINNVNEANISTVQAIANTAQGYADNAEDSKDLAEQAVTDAQAQVTLATTQAENASDSAEDSEAWAVGKRGGVDVPSTDDTYQNNAKYWQERANYWYQQAQIIAESFSGALRPMGTVEFANLPSIASAKSGDMYNISDEFTTTSDFVEGAGIRVPLGSNVYLTVQNKWDILAGSPVTGIKGNAETTYRRGNVNITKDNIGLGNVRNVDIGDTDISGIGNGTVTGAISTLNSDLVLKLSQGDIQSMGYIRVNQAMGTCSVGDRVGMWYKAKSSQSGRLVYIDYMINYSNQTPSDSDTIRLDGFPQTTFVGYNGTVLKTTQTGLAFNANGNTFPSESNHTSDNLMLVALAGALAKNGCGLFKGFLW